MSRLFPMLLFVFLLTLFLSLSFAQENIIPIDNKKQVKINSSNKNIDETQAAGDNIQFKDGTSILMEIKSTGSGFGGQLFMPSILSSSSSKVLYNLEGDLYWGADQVALSGSESSDNGWTISGNNVYNTNTGNIGIGTTNPISKLSVGGSGFTINTIHAETDLVDGPAVYGSAINNNSGAQNYGGYFRASGTEARGVFGFTSGQNSRAVYGNTTGNQAFAVYGNTTGSLATSIHGNATGSEAIAVKGISESANANTNYGGYFVANGTFGRGIYAEAPLTGWAGYFEGNVNITGSLTVNTTLYTSDERFKKNIEPLDNVLNTITNLNIYSYNWNNEKYPKRNFKNDKLQYGVLAQELEEVYPDLVKTDKDGYKSVDYIKLSVITLQAVKELEKQNNELERQNTTYSSYNAELEKRISKIESLLLGEEVSQISK